MADYNGTIELISGIKPKNNGTFPLVNAADVLMPDGTRLSEFGGGNSEDSSGTTLPEYTAEDAGKILKVNANSELYWGVQYKANYEENNESSIQYILNRPFYNGGSWEADTHFQGLTTGYAFTANADTGFTEFNHTIVQDSVDNWAENWNVAKITWDNVTYECAPKYYGGLKWIGDVAGLQNGTHTDGAEPFAITFFMGEDGYPYVRAICLTDTGDTTHYIDTFTLITYDVKRMDSMYAPYAPTFDLAEMGLPDITIGGGTVSVAVAGASCIALNELVEAANTGVVRITALVGGSSFEFIPTVSYDPTGDAYLLSATSAAMGTPVVFDIVIVPSSMIISATATLITGGGSSLPEVTTDDNGKFLRVVDGAWAAVALTDVSVEGA